MSCKVRYGRCGKKVRFDSARAASAGAKSLAEKYVREGKSVPELEVYPCGECCGWHFGNTPRRGHRSKYNRKD